MPNSDLSYPGFIESEIPPSSFEAALLHVLPVELEKSVSYGGGTGAGPMAILKASQQLEAFDGRKIPGRAGIHTHPPVDCQMADTQQALRNIEEKVGQIVAAGKRPLILGGEHSLTIAAAKAIASKNISFGIIQFDAHADLRDTYEGNPFSHACVMRRIWDMGIPFFQVGVRSLSEAENTFRLRQNISFLDAEAIHQYGIPRETVLPPDFPKNIYLSFDVDCLDPAVMPATGTPEPGGINWPQTIDLLKKLTCSRKVIGADVVELAPIEGFHAADFTAAKLAYTLMGLMNQA